MDDRRIAETSVDFYVFSANSVEYDKKKTITFDERNYQVDVFSNNIVDL